MSQNKLIERRLISFSVDIFLNKVFEVLDFQGDYSFRHFGYLSKATETRFRVGVNVECDQTRFFYILCDHVGI